MRVAEAGESLVALHVFHLEFALDVKDTIGIALFGAFTVIVGVKINVVFSGDAAKNEGALPMVCHVAAITSVRLWWRWCRAALFDSFGLRRRLPRQLIGVSL